MRFGVALPDNCHGLEMLAKTIADERAVLKSLTTEQMWVHSDVGTTWVFHLYRNILIYLFMHLVFQTTFTSKMFVLNYLIT